MDTFNVIAGAVGIVGLAFSVWAYLEARRKEAVETEKVATFTYRLADMLVVLNAVSKQATLIANLSDRADTSKKEIKHLLVSQLTTIAAAQEGLSRIRARGAAWEFGLADHYLRPVGTDTQADPGDDVVHQGREQE